MIIIVILIIGIIIIVKLCNMCNNINDIKSILEKKYLEEYKEKLKTTDEQFGVKSEETKSQV